MRLAMRISPSRVSSSTVPISRMYMRTGIGGAAEFGIERGQRGGGFFNGFFVRRRRRLGRENALVVRCLFVHRDAHVVNRVDDLFDLFRIDDFRRQVIVHLRIREVTLFLAARDQQLELRLALFGQHIAARRQIDQFRVALLALLGFGRGGRGGRGGSARGRELLRGLELDDFSLASATGAATLSGALPFTSGFFTSACFSTCLALGCAVFRMDVRSLFLRGMAATAGFAAFFGSFLEAGAVGRLCFCVMRFRRQGVLKYDTVGMPTARSRWLAGKGAHSTQSGPA